MSALDDLREHPIPRKPWLLKTDPNARSFHEVVCDLAKQAMGDPSQVRDLPDQVVHALGTINNAVIQVAASLREIEKI